METVFNLAVEGDETYLAEGVVVHNCRSVMHAVLDGEEIVGDRPFVVDTRRREAREVDFRRIAKERGVSVKSVRDQWAERNIGRVPGKTTYGEWLNRQPAAFQDEVLGRTKGRLYRQGGVKIDEFVDRRGNELTLAQLARQKPEKFTLAGLDPEDF